MVVLCPMRTDKKQPKNTIRQICLFTCFPFVRLRLLPGTVGHRSRCWNNHSRGHRRNHDNQGSDIVRFPYFVRFFASSEFPTIPFLVVHVFPYAFQMPFWYSFAFCIFSLMSTLFLPFYNVSLKIAFAFRVFPYFSNSFQRAQRRSSEPSVDAPLGL